MTPQKKRLFACDLTRAILVFLKIFCILKKNIYICDCQDSTFWRMYHNINYHTMKSKTKFKKDLSFNDKFSRFLNDLENYSQSLNLLLNSNCLSNEEECHFSSALMSAYMLSCYLCGKGADLGKFHVIDND